MKPIDPTIAAIAQQIIDNRATENWQFVFVYVALAIVAIAVSGLVYAYVSARGHLLAAAATLNVRLDEIRLTTDAAERVKIQLAHDDWTVKELKTLRRLQLERLVTAVFKLMYESDTEARLPKATVSFDLPSRLTLIEAEQISLLYFPEFAQETVALKTAHADLSIWIIQERSKIGRQHLVVGRAETAVKEAFAKTPPNPENIQQKLDLHRTEQVSLAALMDDYSHAYSPMRDRLDVSVRAMQKKAQVLMTALIAPSAL